MTAYATGDDAALEPLFDRLAPRVLALFRACIAAPGVAEQLLEQTFMLLRCARHTYRAATGARPFVYGIAVGLCAEHLAPDPAPQRRSVARAAADGGGARALVDAFAAMSGDERLILHLHRREGLRIPQIAAILGVDELEARARLYRVYGRLRERLRPLLDGETS